ncbi:MAG TPA: hypothetical protein VNE38_12020 [Ktedonobacteraceae bacterium]|nr:hypothetical protein [Ktedonobacteraceae bacterium]
MRLRSIVLTIIFLCMIGGLLAGFFSHSIEAALTLQSINGTRQTGAVTPTSTPVATSGQPKAPTPVPGGAVVLAKDTFQRAVQTFWGTASDGHLWAGDANSIEVFSIAGGVGQIGHGNGAFNAVLGPLSTNAEVVFNASVNHFAAGNVNMGAVLRWTDSKNWYKALIDGARLQILSSVNGTITSLATMPFQARDGVTYSLRFRTLGANLFVRAWQSNQTEPVNWMLTVSNTALTQGMGGLRMLTQSVTIIKVTSFLETTVVSPS